MKRPRWHGSTLPIRQHETLLPALIDVDVIMSGVTRVFAARGVTPREMVMAEREQRDEVKRAAEFLAFVLYIHTDMSFPDIASILGRRRGAHTTFINRYNRFSTNHTKWSLAEKESTLERFYQCVEDDLRSCVHGEIDQ